MKKIIVFDTKITIYYQKSVYFVEKKTVIWFEGMVHILLQYHIFKAQRNVLCALSVSGNYRLYLHGWFSSTNHFHIYVTR